MVETAKEAARRLTAPKIAEGFVPTALHEYRDASGAVLYYRIRAKHPETGEKYIRPFHMNGSGFKFGEPSFPSGKKPLYALDQLAAHPNEAAWVTEGESKADALNRLGLVATTSGGAASADTADWGLLRGRVVFIWPDNDDPGMNYAADVSRILQSLGCTVWVIDVASLGLGPKEDVVDWLAKHPDATRTDVEALPHCPALIEVGAPGQSRAGEDADVPTATVAFRCMADVEAKPIRWLWPGRLARGKVNNLSGNPGLGKSQVSIAIAAVVTAGNQWPVDRTPVERGNVIFLSAEDDAADTIRPRLEAAGADLSRVFILDAVVDGFRADGAEIQRAFNLSLDIERLGKLLERIGDVALIVIDPITAYLGSVDSHRNAEIRALLAPLSEIAARHGAAVLCISHLNKSGSSEALMRVTGSLAFVAAARSAWLVAKDPENDSKRLFLPMKNNIGNDQSGLSFTLQPSRVESAAGIIESSRVVWDPNPVTITADEAMAPQDDTEERTAVEDAAEFLRGLLADGPVPSKQIRADAEGAGFSWRSIQRAQKQLDVQAVKEGGPFGGSRQQWVWRLPNNLKNAKYAEGTEERHTNCVAAFKDSGDLQGAVGQQTTPDAEVF